jgi:hypothetical protein
LSVPGAAVLSIVVFLNFSGLEGLRQIGLREILIFAGYLTVALFFSLFIDAIIDQSEERQRLI